MRISSKLHNDEFLEIQQNLAQTSDKNRIIGDQDFEESRQARKQMMAHISLDYAKLTGQVLRNCN